MSETAILRAEIATHNRVYKVQRKLMALLRTCGPEAIIDLCEGLDFIEPVLEHLTTTDEVTTKVKARMQHHKDSSIVKNEHLKGGEVAKARLEILRDGSPIPPIL